MASPVEPTDAIQRFAEHVAGTTYEDLSPAAVLAAKTFILDSIGVAIAGSGDRWAPRLAECAAGWGAGSESTVWGSGQRLPAQGAAFVNAYQIHCLEFDCVHEGAVVHPMATLLSALFAYAERRGSVAGKDLLTAVALGVEVACSLGIASRAPMKFFRPATAGAFGAVAGLSKLAGFDLETLTNAFGILYGQISGTLQPHVEGSILLGMQMGFNARNALAAVDLAAHGLTGPHQVLEGRYGYFKLFEGAYDLTSVMADLGKVWQVTRLSHKPFPSGRLTHGTVDGLLRLKRQYGFEAHEVSRVTVLAPPLVLRLVGRPDIPAPAANYARLCLPFVAATALLRGNVDVPDFAGDRLSDPTVHALARKVELVPDENPDENALVPQTIRVELADGRSWEVRLDSVIGSPETPLTREENLDKFRRCWTYGARRLREANRDRLIALVDQLEQVKDVGELVRLTVP